MQIQCPNCSARLKLGSPKPGRYQPKCKRCGEPFLVHITADTPPRVHIGKPQQRSDPQQARSQQTVAEPRTDAGAVSPSAAAPPTPLPAAARPADSQTPPDTDEITPLPSRMGGYRIIRMLGRGAMGAVYQAKQISLDRDVALKTIRGRLAENPASLARFAREAYAAAQLSHHNVVQIYDFGEEEGQHYFSMEWVRGGSLNDLVREKGSIDPKRAATYILQAARGLQFAHRNGMVHRDIKPANLLLSEDGVVKVADLGLVKVPDQVDPDDSGDRVTYSGMESGTQVTLQGTAVGTPAYMAPEQSSDASTVDHRADIYSLGCSLFFLLAGRSPFDGTEASEVMQQHANAPLPELSQINARVPDSLQDIVKRSMAKRPSDRYSSLAEMIDDLQEYLGVETLMGFSPRSDQADRWEEIVAAYSKTQFQDKLGGIAWVGCALVSIVITLVATWWSPFAVFTGATFFVVSIALGVGLSATLRPNALADRTRRFVGSVSWLELGIAAFVLSVFSVVVLVSGLWIGVAIGTVAGAAAAAIYHFAIDRTSVAAGAQALKEARRFVRDLRLDGADENGLRDFLARYAGRHWQGIYEALFGYDALVVARKRLRSDPAFDAPLGGDQLRDRICDALAKRTEANRKAADRKKLAKLEQRSLLSQGLSASEAVERSWQMASAIMETSRLSSDSGARDERSIADAKRQRIKAMLADARSGQYRRPPDRYAALKFAFSGYFRMLAGSLLLAAFGFAAQASGLTAENIVSGVRHGALPVSTGATTDALGWSTSVWSLGIAGLLLCLSAFVSGWRMTPFATVATLIILFGAALGIPPIEIPAVGQASAWSVSAVVGFLVYVPGVIYGEREAG